jgi:peptidoglycan-associated lipoprotein
MKRSITFAMLAASVFGLSACGKKPAPADISGMISGDGQAAQQTSGDYDADGNYIGPGSQADLLRNAGSDRVFFQLNSFGLDNDDRDTLRRQAEWLARNPNVSITIEGHCDERGTREYNIALGDRRANAAKNFLQALGVSANRMNTVSYGKERPAASGSDEESWAQNRRAVTIVIREM